MMRKKNRLSSDELRQLFLDFFREKDHPILPGSPLAPHDDPTLLFNTAGMVQFKPYYVAKGAIPYRRAATVQPCLRASDLESVGRTARHHTFFEMLGNFSFGDYFKEEAILWAWEFSVDRLGLPADKIIVSVYQDDDEAAEIWEKKVGIDSRKILRRGKKDNYWGPAGNSGPCGPCSELHLDMRENGGDTYDLDAEGDSILEYWNLVFPQFDQTPEGEKLPLPNRGIDTGMGLERLCQIMQGVATNYETDLFVPIIETVRGYSKGIDTERGDGLEAVRVIADHTRALVFSVNEGVLPGNEGRGYVLRRLLRRALLRANRLGIQDLVFDRIGEAVIDKMRGAYPDLEKNRARIVGTIRAEEERFRKTLENGLEVFRRVTFRLRENEETSLSGQDIFRLYDTYGFPVELTEELAVAEGFTLDTDSYRAEMEEQRSRSRWTVGDEEESVLDLTGIESRFVGYDHDRCETEIVALYRGGARVESLDRGDEGVAVLAESPFYAESGGQVGDRGSLAGEGEDPVFQVNDTRKSEGDHPLLIGVAKISFGVGDRVRAQVESARRKRIEKNHTATHLLHKALRTVLGDHVHQAGSLVAPDRLRFDFVHHSKTTAEEIDRIERMVNEKILENVNVDIREVGFDEAKKAGAMALFGVKYGDRVRMVSVDDWSRELCGGLHVSGTGEIGPFLITTESAVGSGNRRIEAITGHAALDRIRNGRMQLASIAEQLRTTPEEASDRLAALQARTHELEKELLEARQSVAGDQFGELLQDAESLGDVRIVAAVLKGSDPPGLKSLVDRYRNETEKVIVVLGIRTGDKAFLVAGVTDDLLDRGYAAGDLVGRVAAKLGGRGGGKQTFAQAGAKDGAGLDAAIQAVPEIVRSLTPGG